jgi:hypothetical protein
VSYASVIFFVLIAWSVAARPGTVLVLLLASVPFLSLALLPPEITAGMTLLPQIMFAVVLVLKVVAPEAVALSPKLLSALQFRKLGCLALFFLFGILATLIMPTMFEGVVVVMPMRNTLGGAALISPIQANFTQSGYVTLSVMTAFAVTLMADEPGFTKTLLAGLLAGGAACLATGLIDIAASFTGMESLLEPFRNAQYAYLTNAGTGVGLRRVVGFTPEASAYGPICVQFAAVVVFVRDLYAKSLHRKFATVLAVGLLIMAVLSTSSTAYAGLAILGLVYSGNWIRRAIFPSPVGRSGLLGELLVGLALSIMLLFLVIVRLDLFDPLFDLIDEVILRKPMSASFLERSQWNSVAWDTIASTWGLGIGFGSTRTSSWFTAVISNAGLIGAAFMGIFLIRIFVTRPISRMPFSAELLIALKLSLLPALAMASVDAAGPDFGIWMGVMFGAITGIAAHSVDHIALQGRARASAPGPRAIGGRTFGRVRPAAARQDDGPNEATPRPSF